MQPGGVNQAGAKFGQTGGVNAAKGSVVNVTDNYTGISGDTLATLLGAVTQSATPQQVATIGPGQPSPFAPPPAATPDPNAEPAKTGTDWTQYYWIGGVLLALAIVGWIFGKSK